MKKLIIAGIFGILLSANFSARAQVNININTSVQPDWGPSGYDHVDYYYLPDIDTYYYVPSKQFVYLIDNQWKWRNSLPAKYSGYNLYNAYKVVVNKPKAYLDHNKHVQQYSSYKTKGTSQKLLRDTRGQKSTPDRGSSASPRVSQTQRKTTTTKTSRKSVTKQQGKDNNGKKSK